MGPGQEGVSGAGRAELTGSGGSWLSCGDGHYVAAYGQAQGKQSVGFKVGFCQGQRSVE